MNVVPTPLIGISCNIREDGRHVGHSAGHRFVSITTDLLDACPVLLPAGGRKMCVDLLLERLDGVVLTGGASNIEPHHYGQKARYDATLRDPGRDNLVLPLIRGAVARGLPLFGICRGIQEMNVAFGGSLHQYLHEVPGREDHRRQRDLPMGEAMYTKHKLTLTPGGLLSRLVGGGEAIRVNSLHGQGLDRLGERVEVEAVAEDGTIEAISIKDAPGFALGVQWHAEWRVDAFPLHRTLFRHFAEAVHDYARRRLAPPVPHRIAAE